MVCLLTSADDWFPLGRGITQCDTREQDSRRGRRIRRPVFFSMERRNVTRHNFNDEVEGRSVGARSQETFSFRESAILPPRDTTFKYLSNNFILGCFQQDIHAVRWSLPVVVHAGLVREGEDAPRRLPHQHSRPFSVAFLPPHAGFLSLSRLSFLLID